MTARIAALAVVGMLLVGAAPAGAADRLPRELWSEYPLAPPAAAPLTPPLRGDGGSTGVVGVAVPERGDRSDQVPWLVVAPLVAVAVLIGLVVVRRLARPTAGGVAEGHFPESPATEAFETCAVRLVPGMKSSRFVAELEERGRRRLLAASPSFPRGNAGDPQLGTTGWRAWHALIDRLEGEGWELVPRWGALEGEPITAEEASAARLVRTAPHGTLRGADEPFPHAGVG